MEPVDVNESEYNDTPPSPASSIRQDYPFEFTGQTGEYFRIWIVNILLTIVTLGIYSAWAKVRNQRYFYGNTILDGSSFEYTAEPLRILRGRIIAVVVVIIYQGVALISPMINMIAFVVLMAVLPAIIVYALRFRMRYSSWRSIRFGFIPNFKHAYLLFGLPILFSAAMLWLSIGFQEDMEALTIPIEEQQHTHEHEDSVNNEDTGGEALAQMSETADDETVHSDAEAEAEAEAIDKETMEKLQASTIEFAKIFGAITVVFWLLFPLWQRYYFRFVATNSQYGRERFNFIATATEFYSVYIIAGLLLIGAGVVASLVTAAVAAFELTNVSIVSVLIGVLVMAPFLFAQAYVQTQKTNIVYSNLELGDIAFSSQLKVPMMAWLYISNTVAILLSLGLLVPWAKIRMARYRASTMTLYANNFNEFQARAAGEVGAEGAEISDFMDIDLGL